MSDFARVAAAQYPIEEPETLNAYLGKLTRWVEAAVDQADVLVFPEYSGAEAMAVLGRAANQDLLGATKAFQSLIPDIHGAVEALARKHGCYILSPSLPERSNDGRIRNVTRFWSPSGAYGSQDKLILTPYDREDWAITPGEGQTLFDTPFGKMGVAICYDIEFPKHIRSLTEAGAEIILCPSCTDTLAGYWRVRVGAMARALENQCAVVQAPTVGDAAWTPALDVNRGAAGVFVPPDSQFNDNGVLALGELDQPQWVFASVDLTALLRLRNSGDVRTFKDWSKQIVSPPKLLTLT